MSGFIVAAKQYLLTGKPFEELCTHNASVAENLGKRQVWNKLCSFVFEKCMSHSMSQCDSSDR